MAVLVAGCAVVVNEEPSSAPVCGCVLRGCVFAPASGSAVAVVAAVVRVWAGAAVWLVVAAAAGACGVGTLAATGVWLGVDDSVDVACCAAEPIQLGCVGLTGSWPAILGVRMMAVMVTSPGRTQYRLSLLLCTQCPGLVSTVSSPFTWHWADHSVSTMIPEMLLGRMYT